MPPSFSGGLAVWSSEDGTPGSATYDGIGTAAIVPGDTDFGPCLELLKTDSVQKKDLCIIEDSVLIEDLV